MMLVFPQAKAGAIFQAIILKGGRRERCGNKSATGRLRVRDATATHNHRVADFKTQDHRMVSAERSRESV